jgi:DeoR/GlpR family transcriptional regulator of sugar metabolism
MLEEQGAVSVSELTDHFNVSAMTIRRDLAALSESGIVSRSGGGATLKHGSLFELDISQNNPLLHGVGIFERPQSPELGFPL